MNKSNSRRMSVKEDIMIYNDPYIQRVRACARFTSDEDAVMAIRAVLEIPGQRITRGQADDLAPALQVDFRRYLRQPSGAQPFGLDEFLMRVADKEGVDSATAAEHARAVLSALAEVVSREELIDTLEQLPKEIRDLFTLSKKAA